MFPEQLSTADTRVQTRARHRQAARTQDFSDVSAESKAVDSTLQMACACSYIREETEQQSSVCLCLL